MLFRYKLPATTLFFCLLWAAPVRALFGVGFQAFLKNQYGATIATQLIRSDLGTNGSFGGNVFPDPIKIFRDPVILVHGLNSNASGMHELRDFLHKGGYGEGEVYGTSYGPASTTIDADSKLECKLPKQLRNLIRGVSAYTGGRKVSIVAHSFGVPIVRKAILGGSCVDTKENIGQPLTSMVSIFVSVAGANFGSAECNTDPTPPPICNNMNGLKSGSAFLKDINSKSGYEGQARYAVVSKQDEIVGLANSILPSSQINVTLENFDHGGSFENTLNIQQSLVKKGFVTQRTIDKDAYAETLLVKKNCSGSVVGNENFQTGPHESQVLSLSHSDGEFPGEYNKAKNTYTFISGMQYRRNSNMVKGKFLKVRSKPTRG